MASADSCHPSEVCASMSTLMDKGLLFSFLLFFRHLSIILVLQERVIASERESGEIPVLSSDKVGDQSEDSYDDSDDDDQSQLNDWPQFDSVDLSGKQLYLKLKSLFTARPLQLVSVQS